MDGFDGPHLFAARSFEHHWSNQAKIEQKGPSFSYQKQKIFDKIYRVFQKEWQK